MKDSARTLKPTGPCSENVNRYDSPPVLVINFNRPDFTQRVLEVIQAQSPSAVYIAVDGARQGRLDDASACRIVRQLAHDFSPGCPVHCLFQERNLGTGIAVPTAISWFFEHESQGIILEDDCIPRPDFFRFTGELLARYANDPGVMMISGNSFAFDDKLSPSEYTFARNAHIWGWATWRRAWDLYDHSMTEWPSLRETKWLLNVCKGHKDAVRYWKWIFDETRKNKVDAWDYRWWYSMWRHDGFSVVPPLNLVENVGFDERSTHTIRMPNWFAEVPRDTLTFPLHHPTVARRNEVAERWIDVHRFSTNLSGVRRLKQVVLRALSHVHLDQIALAVASRIRMAAKRSR